MGIDYATAKATAEEIAFFALTKVFAIPLNDLLFALIVVCNWLKEVTNTSLVAYTPS